MKGMWKKKEFVDEEKRGKVKLMSGVKKRVNYLKGEMRKKKKSKYTLVAREKKKLTEFVERNEGKDE